MGDKGVMRYTEKRITADTAFRLRSAVACFVPYILISFMQAFESILTAIFLIGFFVVVGFPMAIIVHLARKPIVYAEGKTIVVVPNAGASRTRIRKQPGEYRMRLLPNSRIELRCFSWLSDLRPGGYLPSKMILVPRLSDLDEWIALAKE